MTATLGNQVDEASTQRLLAATNSADAQCDAAQRAVDSTASYLTTQWVGEASGAFTGSLQRWQEGLVQVKQGLADLNTAMTTFYQLSAQLEADNHANATWT